MGFSDEGLLCHLLAKHGLVCIENQRDLDPIFIIAIHCLNGDKQILLEIINWLQKVGPRKNF